MRKTALIAGQGGLPAPLVAALKARGEEVIVAALDGFPPDLPDQAVETFRIERLVPFMDRLADRGVTDVCLAGAVRRPKIEPELFDARTASLVPRLLAALRPGDDAALRIVMDLFEEHGFSVRAAHEIAPNLLPPAGILTTATPRPSHDLDAECGEAQIEEMGRADSGQACVIAGGQVIVREGPEGTDAMLRTLGGKGQPGGILFKAPKPGQDRRADLPVIGPGTAALVAEAGLAGIVIEAGGVMVLDQPRVRETLDGLGLFLWVRPRGFRR
jgi:DUF1009 family protein